MKNVLVIKSSILANSSQSSRLIDYLKSKISANIVEHDFGVNPLPYYDLDAATGTRGEPKTAEQQKAFELSNQLIGEVNKSDVLVFGVPMYNLGIPAQLKTYIDYLNRAGVTFRYTANGSEGLITGKKAVVILTYGGIYKDGLADLPKLYMQTVLNFIGITDIEFVYAEGIGYGSEAIEKAQQSAKAELDRIAETF
ncbi:FMN-dependent NADH-azoreductase [Haemophilus parahaemolyticus]|uniref:FMN dependent NADH:quinone oxidoreductase n=2 Tax=Haemophilus parahaemolyticus TaxID=735 RepID=A0AAE6JSC1_HAEPH|nr:NAD(P)H-dependent oxidoreductase [Haemophilus parahaemolyticus]EIJ72392.1 NAD(P)H dehydrogenase (quinone) [Haemophilus parahaemolyticus HK385]OOR96696.1 FMN-dependent NADH-azoreductase [Haemophilus parahaemolyticus]QEN10858.1 FMN-dependent NADH-azoreductase [Haemophilus parahaemolyticus]QRP12047.1 NAD(P)H-dependent oxidoreductase [Haemophilus parahaemolyticus]STO67190.1 FMN-dependent NADH-azoreductase [Haemophilus parahaemolyticus HK385]